MHIHAEELEQQKQKVSTQNKRKRQPPGGVGEGSRSTIVTGATDHAQEGPKGGSSHGGDDDYHEYDDDAVNDDKGGLVGSPSITNKKTRHETSSLLANHPSSPETESARDTGKDQGQSLDNNTVLDTGLGNNHDNRTQKNRSLDVLDDLRSGSAEPKTTSSGLVQRMTPSPTPLIIEQDKDDGASLAEDDDYDF